MSWEKCKLESLCNLITDGKHGDCKNEFDSGYYFLSAKDIKDGEIDYSNAREITKEDFLDVHKRTRFEPNDILLTNSGTIGRMAIANTDEKIHRTTFQKSVAIIKPIQKKVLTRFLYYTFRYKIEEIVNYASGTAQKNLLLRDLRNYKVRVPPLETQRKIASILSAYDDLIENNNHRIKILEEMAHTIYKEWFVNFRFPGYDKTKFVNSPLGRIPEGWEWKDLGEVANILMGQSPKSEFYNKEEVGLPFHQGVSDFGFRFPTHKTYCSIENRLATKDDILFSVRAPVGRINIANTKLIIGRGLSAIRHKENLQSFLLYSLKNEFSEEDIIGSGAIFNSVTKNDMKTIKIISSDDEIDKRFNELVKPLDSEIKNLNSKISNLRKTRDLLLPKLMSGEVEV